MAHLAKLWAGSLFGTNTGKVFVEFDLSGRAITGTARFLDDAHGLSVFSLNGTFDGSKLEFEGQPQQAEPEVQLGAIRAVAVLQPDGQLRGRWQSTLGTAGAFQLFPHQDPNAPPPTQPGPRELHTVVKRLGVVRLGASDVRELINQIESDFPSGQLILTFEVQGNERSIYAVDFQKHVSSLGALKRFRLQIQEPEGNGVNRILAVELDSTSGNLVRAQSAQEAWAVGKAETIALLLRRNRVRVATWLKRSGVLAILFLSALLILSPEILSLRDRTVFVVSLLLLLALAGQLLNRLIPDAEIYPAQERQSILAKAWPTILSGGITILTTVASGLVYAWLSGMLFPS